VNENFDGIENMLDSMAKEMRDGVMRGMEDALETVFSEKAERIDELEEKNKELKDRLEEAKNQGAEIGDPEPLSSKQAELADLVEDNPEKDVEWLSEKLETPVNKVRQLESQIRDKGYSFSID
jgi:DNA repair exonuclease SbcCD ATPase subunit